MVDNRIRSVVILGGGTAGWMAAAYLGKTFGETIDITVVEAPTIPRIGVGEASIPLLQNAFFNHLEVPEHEWMRACNASFKMAVKFINWRSAGQADARPKALNGGTDHFYHPFGILPNHNHVPLSHYWFLRREKEIDRRFD